MRASAFGAFSLLLALTGCGDAEAPAETGRIVLTRAAKNPLALAVTPNEDVYFIERTGEVRLFRRLTGLVDDALVLDVDASHESGLLGLALDPAFGDNGLVYLYASIPLAEPVPTSGPRGQNVLARYSARPDGTLDPASRFVLLTVPSERRCCHEGGALAFAPDGTLFLSTGDNTNPFASSGLAPLDGRPGRETFDARRTAANPFDLRGKILRIAADGSIPEGNLFPPSGDEGRPEIYAMGVRNPFRLAVDPVDGRLFFGDLGPDAPEDVEAGPRGHDEIDLATAPGDFGWPRCIGQNLAYRDVDASSGALGALFDCTDSIPALLAYDYDTPTVPALGTATTPDGAFLGRAAMAGAVYRAPAGAPFALDPRLDGALVMMDWSRDIIAAVHANADGTLATVERLFATERFHRPIDVDVGPDGALYVLEYGSGFWGDNDDAVLSRMEGGTRRSPVAVISASATHGPVPLEVTFSAKGSRPALEGDALADWAWDFDQDGVADAHGPTVVRRFDAPGTHGVSLTVTTKTGAKSRPAGTTVVAGNAPPRVRMLVPDPAATLVAGVPVTLEGDAFDPEDGAAPCDELFWTVSLGHDAHAHPDLTLSGCTPTFTPELTDHADASPSELVFVAIELAYTDHGGANGEAPLTARKGIKVDVVR